jgi:hypothetical protein
MRDFERKKEEGENKKCPKGIDEKMKEGNIEIRQDGRDEMFAYFYRTCFGAIIYSSMALRPFCWAISFISGATAFSWAVASSSVTLSFFTQTAGLLVPGISPS